MICSLGYMIMYNGYSYKFHFFYVLFMILKHILILRKE